MLPSIDHYEKWLSDFQEITDQLNFSQIGSLHMLLLWFEYKFRNYFKNCINA